MAKSWSEKLLSLVLVFLMIAGVAASFGSVSFAAGPLVRDFCGDMWIWPGGGNYAWVWASEALTGASLQRKDGSTWQTVGTCESADDENDYWSCYIDTEAADEGKSWSYRFVLTYSGGTAYSDEFTVYVTRDLDWDRIAGKNRFYTAADAADLLAEKTGNEYRNVIVACGTDFADALGGTYLAAKYDAPILLVNSTSFVMDNTADKIASKLASGGRVFILGGPGAVPEYMEIALEDKGIDGSRVTRFAGVNRYDTNLKILKACDLSTEEIMVCCGTDFADALSASAIGYPVLMVGKTLTEDQKDFCNTLDPEYVNMVGGTGAVPAGIKEWFDQSGFETWRYAGRNRYETSYMLAYDYTLQQSYYVFMAYALDFPDGLAAGPLAYAREAPLLLVNNSNYMYAERFVSSNDCRIGIVMGGPSLIADATVDRIMYGTDLTGASGSPEAVRAAAAETDKEPAPAPEWSKRSIR